MNVASMTGSFTRFSARLNTLQPRRGLVKYMAYVEGLYLKLPLGLYLMISEDEVLLFGTICGLISLVGGNSHCSCSLTKPSGLLTMVPIFSQPAWSLGRSGLAWGGSLPKQQNAPYSPGGGQCTKPLPPNDLSTHCGHR